MSGTPRAPCRTRFAREAGVRLTATFCGMGERAAAAVLLSLLGCATVAGCGGGDEGTRELRTAWTVTGVGPGARSLEVTVEEGNCERNDERVTVEESAKTISVHATKREPNDELVSCSLVSVRRPINAQLDRPVAGRSIKGLRALRDGPISPHPVRNRPIGAPPLFFVPRVTGLRARDALLVLRQTGFRAELGSSGRLDDEVVGTRPAARCKVPAETALRVLVK